MLQTLRNAWKTPELRNKLIFVLVILLLYRIGTVIPVPFVDATNFSSQFGGTILDYMNTLSGGALSSATLFALGISPYITASIVLQLLTVAIPPLQRRAKDGEAGKKFMTNLTRITTVILALITAIGYYMLLSNGSSGSSMISPIARSDSGSWTWILYAATIIICYCAGASLIMWLGEKINENGIGNGISLILFANIVSGAPSFVIQLFNVGRYAVYGQTTTGMKILFGSLAGLFGVFVVAVVIALTVFVIFVTGSERRIRITYAKRVVGRKMYGGQSSNLPIKLNMTGVMPIIFASSIVSLPATIMTLAGVSTTNFWYKLFASASPVYAVLLFVLIIAFAYFYVTISFDPIEVSNNLKKNGGTIPGIRQGKPTADFIRRILNRVTLMGALFLSVVALLPVIAGPLVVKPLLTALVSDYMTGIGYGSQVSTLVTSLASSFTFGGTSLLIVVGVALETFRELEAQLTMRNYKGFLS